MRDTGSKCASQLLEKTIEHFGRSPNFCLCSAGMLEGLFMPFCDGYVKTEIIKAIGLGDDYCEFIIHLNE